MSEEEAVKFFESNSIRSGGESKERVELRAQAIENVSDEITITNWFTDGRELIDNLAHLLEVIITALTASCCGLKKTPQLHDLGGGNRGVHMM
jgi:hypothetical protein